MGFISLFFPWGVLLQAVAIVHFIRRRPDTLWLWVIIFLGPLGALIYIFMEVIPDLGLLRQSFDAFGRRKRIGQLEAIVLDNPAVGNYEELADLYLDEGKFARARDCYDKAISSRADQPDPIYRRGVAKVHLGEFTAALPDLEHVTSRDRKLRLPPRDRAARARLCQYRAARSGGSVVPAGDGDFHAVGDLFQLRVVPRLAEPSRRSAPVGLAHPGKEADHAALLAAAGASMVPQGEGIVETDPGVRLMRLFMSVIAVTTVAVAQPSDSRSTTAERVMKLTRDSVWSPVAAVPIKFTTHHPQGMVKIGDTYFVSSVEIKVPDQALSAARRRLRPGCRRGRGPPVQDRRRGASARRSAAGGSVRFITPAGSTTTAGIIWVPVAEYRPDSRSIIYRVDPAT